MAAASSLIPPSGPGRSPGARRAFAWRWGRRLFFVGTAVFAALFVSILTIDLGRIPGLKKAAEDYATNWLARPMHIGKLSVRPGAGEYIINDFVIDGVGGGRPFFSAKTIIIRMSWTTVWQRRLMFDVRLYDWQMLVERWSDPDRHNIPRLTGPPRPPRDPNKPNTFTSRTVTHAERGAFIYEDHGTPWSVVAPNLTFDMVWSVLEKKYTGLASFTKGTVKIQDFLPMSAEMSTRFTLEGTLVNLPHIDLKTDGADTHVTGHLDFSKWPEQSYTLNSTMDFARMNEIFFAKEHWSIGGTGHFAGMFNIYKDERGRDLSGDFTSDFANVERLKFSNLHGSLVWLRDRFAVTHADADFYGGDTRFAYAIEPFGQPGGATQKFVADIERVDLRQLKQVFDLKGLELEGRARGRVAMAWPSGHLRQGVAGYGEITAMPPDGVQLATVNLPAPLAFKTAAPAGEFTPKKPLGPLPVGGELTFRFDPEGVTFGDSTVATPTTFVALKGRYDGSANLPFHVTSRDWQASDRLLAAIMTARGGTQIDPVEVGGVGTFDGVMTETFDAPCIQGHFAADDMAMWKVIWGHGEGDVVIHDKYLDVTKGVMRRDAGTIRSDGRFALGFPRADGKEEIRANVKVQSWPLDDLRVAFGKEKVDWPIDGLIASAVLDLHGKYGDNGLYGSGPLKLEHGKAWTEPFETATGDLTFNGPTVDLAHMRITKGTGALTGAGTVGWDKTYSFEAKGERIAVESLDFFKLERAPLTGVMSLTASGQGTFDAPTYRVHADTPDLSAGDQVIGHTQADITVENGTLTIERLDAESNRLRAFSHGQVKLNDQYDTVFTARFEDASIDPYLKFVTTKNKWSDFVHAVVFGNARASGPLKDVTKMQLEATITQGTLSLWDYELKNDGDINFTVKDQKLTIGQFKLTGKDTNVALVGSLSMADSTADLKITGDANLVILEGPDRLSKGTATLDASIKGALDNPVLSGTADIHGGEFRYGTLPRLQEISGQVTFDDKGINAEGVRAKMGGGDVTFGGNVTLRLDEYRLDEYNLTATGTHMTVRYPEGFQSTVDATLSLTGPVKTPLLSGDVNVLSAAYIKRIDPDVVALLGLAAAGGGEAAVLEEAALAQAGQTLTYDINIHALPSTLKIDNKAGTHIEGGGDLHYSGPADRPSLIGNVDIISGAVALNGNRYVIRSGSIEFSNPNKIEPYFSVFAVTRPRAPGQTFEVSVSLEGTASKLGLTLSSDPWLSEYDIVRLLFGEAPGEEAAEARNLRRSEELPAMFQLAAAQMLAAPISSRVGSAFSALPGAPSVNISPVLGGPDLSTSATARVTVGKQLSSKAYIFYTRTLNNAQNEFIQLEYEQSERLSWVLSRNEDRTFALEFRIRRIY